jgi:hypothetical protein
MLLLFYVSHVRISNLAMFKIMISEQPLTTVSPFERMCLKAAGSASNLTQQIYRSDMDRDIRGIRDIQLEGFAGRTGPEEQVVVLSLTLFNRGVLGM